MLILVIIGISTLLQAGVYWLMRNKDRRLLSLGLLFAFIFLNVKVFPVALLPDPPPGNIGECGFSYRGFGIMMFMVLGNIASVVIYLVNYFIRRTNRKGSAAL
jgi:hypothetical protein